MAVVERHPLLLRWDASAHPLPMRIIHPKGKGPATARNESERRPFDFCAHMRRLCEDIASRCAPFWHLDMSRLLLGVTQARTGRRHGLQARLTPLRFRNGALIRRHGGFDYQVQRYVVNGREMLYLVTFCLPRFLDQNFEDKLVTIFHELYHISPAFDGDFRRHKGRYRLHSHSQRGYDAHMLEFVRAYLDQGAPPPLLAFLRYNFAQLQARYGSIAGVVVPRPKIVPLTMAQEQAARTT